MSVRSEADDDRSSRMNVEYPVYDDDVITVAQQVHKTNE